jgi:hypothetical protein
MAPKSIANGMIRLILCTFSIHCDERKELVCPNRDLRPIINKQIFPKRNYLVLCGALLPCQYYYVRTYNISYMELAVSSTVKLKPINDFYTSKELQMNCQIESHRINVI